MHNLVVEIKAVIRDVPNFPKDGILFKDISTLLLKPELSNKILDALVEHYQDQHFDAVAGIESRGFLFGHAMAMRLNKPFVLIRKAGKLPANKISHSYELEYGSATLEIHSDAILKNARVLIHDDLLATGGSAEAAALLIQKASGVVTGFSVLVELEFLSGRQRLHSISDCVNSIVQY